MPKEKVNGESSGIFAGFEKRRTIRKRFRVQKQTSYYSSKWTARIEPLPISDLERSIMGLKGESECKIYDAEEYKRYQNSLLKCFSCESKSAFHFTEDMGVLQEDSTRRYHLGSETL